MSDRAGCLGLGLVVAACAGAAAFHVLTSSVTYSELYFEGGWAAGPMRWLAWGTAALAVAGSALGAVGYVAARRRGSFSLVALLAGGFGAAVVTPSALYALWLAREFGTHVLPQPGRPLRRAGPTDAPAQPLSEEASLGQQWARAAQAEHASVAAFQLLAAELEALRAPAELIERCGQAAQEEAGHARLAQALARRFGGETVLLDEVEIPVREPVLSRVAVESLVDGVLNEGLAARLAQLGAATAVEPEVRAALATIAAEEASHAKLAADIVSWALSTGDLETATAVARCRLPFPKTRPGSPQDGGVGRLGGLAAALAAFCEAHRLQRMSGVR